LAFDGAQAFDAWLYSPHGEGEAVDELSVAHGQRDKAPVAGIGWCGAVRRHPERQRTG
jgi:hypothetical protein